MSRPLILPPMRRTAHDAECFAEIVHRGQIDKAGAPYFGHPTRVAARVADLAELVPSWTEADFDRAMQLAWLHDVLEPDERPFGPLTCGDLAAEGFAQSVIARAYYLAGCPGSGFLAGLGYVARLRELLGVAIFDLACVLVKLADVRDNADPARLALLPPETAERLRRKYVPAEVLLIDAARARGAQRV